MKLGGHHSSVLKLDDGDLGLRLLLYLLLYMFKISHNKKGFFIKERAFKF